jgi:hypothetical protein
MRSHPATIGTRQQEAHGLVETELRPLIQAALERHQAIEVDHHRGGRQVEQHEGEQPEDDVRRSEFAGDADPREADDEEDLREGEIANAELLFNDALCASTRASACASPADDAAAGSGNASCACTSWMAIICRRRWRGPAR